MLTHRMIVVLLLWMCSLYVTAQCDNPVCATGNCPPTLEAADAPLYCDLADLNGRTFATGPLTVGTMPTGFCGAVENGHWYAFLAPAAQVTFFLDVENCTNTTGGSGLQMMVFESVNACNELLGVSNCFAPGDGTDGSAVATDLTIGEVYYLFIDGWAGDQCAYTLSVTEGLAPTPVPAAPATIDGPAAVCPGATVNYSLTEIAGATRYTWTLNNPDVANITAGQGTSTVSVEVFAAGTVTLSVTAGNACATSPPTERLLTSAAPVSPPPETVVFCLGEPVVWQGDVYDPALPGPQLKTYQTALGCDSTVVGLFLPVAPTSEALGTITVCPGEPFQIGNVGFGTPGDYEFVLENGNASGCDSTLMFSIAVETVNAQIAPANPTLDCGQPFVTLDGTASTNATEYAWRDAAQNVLATTSTYDATAPGDYELLVTGPNGCTDLDTVTITSVGAVATVGSVSGTDEICPNLSSVEIYQANAVTNADTLLWTVPAGASFSVLDATSIEVTWTSAPGGSVCAQPLNACGTGGVVCLDVEALPTTEVTLSGDTLLCAGAQTQLLLLVDGPATVDVTLMNTQGNLLEFPNLGPGTNTIDVIPTVPTSYSISMVTAPDCPAPGGGTAQIAFYDPLAATETVALQPDGTSYEVCLDLSGGAGQYAVNGSPVGGAAFCQIFACDEPASFSITDSSACDPLDLDVPAPNCGCTNAVGSVSTDSLLVCPGGLATGTYDAAAQLLDAGDTLVFVLHDAAGSSLGGVVAQHDQPEFAFDPASMTLETVYYLSPVVAPATTTGFDATADCVQVGAGTPVVFLRPPTLTVQISTDTLCRGDFVVLNATSSTDLTGTVNGLPYPLFTGLLVDSFQIFANTDLFVDNVTSSRGGCAVADFPQLFSVVAVEPARAGTQSTVPTLCAPVDAPLDLFGLLDGADTGGVWVQTDGPAANFNADLGLLTGPSPGAYAFTYTVENAFCGSAAAVVNLEVLAPPVADAGADRTLDCAPSTLTLTAAGGGGAGTTVQWRNANGILLSETPTLDVDGAGTYLLTVTTDAGGCSATDTVVVFPNDAALRGAWTVLDESCFGAADGALLLDSLTGGVAPVEFSLDGGTFGRSGNFQNLPGGAYELRVRSADGCEFDTTLLVPSGLDPQLVLGANFSEPDNGLLAGDSLTVTLLTNLTAADSFRLRWSPVELFGGCDSCLVQTVAPTESTFLVATLQTARGCLAETSLRVRVLDRGVPVYMPTGFSPNGDGENDRLFPQADPAFVVRIRALRVFDRWGTLVFQRTDFAPNDATRGWNGQLDGVNAPAGVYVYQVDYQTVTGAGGVFHGTTLLVR